MASVLVYVHLEAGERRSPACASSYYPPDNSAAQDPKQLHEPSFATRHWRCIRCREITGVVKPGPPAFALDHRQDQW